MIRVPYRMLFYIEGTGWYQDPTCEGNRTRERLRIALKAAPRLADRSRSIPSDPAILDALRIDAGHLLHASQYGDHTLDELADGNAARAMLRRIEAAYPIAEVTESEARVLDGNR